MAPRKRNRFAKVPVHIDASKLPPYVYYNPRWRGRWVIKEYDPDTQKCKEKRIGDSTITLPDIWRAWEEITGKATNTFQWLSELYMEGEDNKRLSKASQHDNQRYHERICRTAMKSGFMLGDKPLIWWDRTKVQRYLDQRLKQNAPVSGNREASYMRTVFKWGLNRGHVPEGVGNPAIGPKRNKEKPRSRYVEDGEYKFVHDLSKTRDSWYLPYIMEIMYLCRCRQIEALSLDRFKHVKEEGFFIERRKGSRNNITEWSPRLRAAIDGALKDPKRPNLSSYVFPSSDGRHIRSSTFQSAWQRLMSIALKNGLKERFTSEDLKPKGTSDTKGTAADKMKATGHKTVTMITRVYDRKPGKVKPVK